MSTAGRSRVALVSSSYAPHIGGVEQHTAAVARELRDRGHAVEVWTVDRGEALGVVAEDGIPVRYLPTPLPAASPSALGSFGRAFPAAWRAWRSAYRSFRPDLLHVQCFGPNGVYAELLGTRTGTPRVVSSHGETQADDHNAFERSLLLRTALRRAVQASEVTGCSRSVGEDLQARFGASGVTVVPNGVDLATVPDLGEVRREPGRIVAAGRLERNKGFDLLLDAVALLPGDVTVELVGSGSQERALLAQAAALGLSDRVTVTGNVSQAEVLRRMAAAAVVCVPSRKEAFGIVVLEAWAVGTPVVATSLCGPAHFVQDGVDALLADPRDAEALAAGLAEASDPAVTGTLSANGRESVRRYTWGRTVERYEAVYGTALDRA